MLLPSDGIRLRLRSLAVDAEDREDDQALDQLLVERVHLQDVEQLVQGDEDERAAEYADDRAFAAEEADAADHDGGDRRQEQRRTEIGRSDARLRELEQAGQRAD